MTGSTPGGVLVTDVSDAGTDPAGVPVTDPAGTGTESPLGVNPNDDLDPTDDPTTTLITSLPALTLDKAADVAAAELGDVITYTYTVNNSGNVTLYAPFMITDDKIGTFECVGAPVVLSLAPTESFDCSATYTVVAGDLVSPWTVVNVASVTASSIDRPD